MSSGRALGACPLLEGELDAARGQSSATAVEKDGGACPDAAGKQRASVVEIHGESLSAGFSEKCLALLGAFAPDTGDAVAEIKACQIQRGDFCHTQSRAVGEFQDGMISQSKRALHGHLPVHG